MRKKLLALGLASAALFAGHDAMAYYASNTITVNASATVASPVTISLNKTQHKTAGELNFGTVTQPTSLGGANVYISESDTRTTDGGCTTIGGETNCGAAWFDVKGEPNVTVSITADLYTVLSNNANSTIFAYLSLSSTSILLDMNGNGSGCVFGHLAIPYDASSGSYSGTFKVDANYQ